MIPPLLWPAVGAWWGALYVAGALLAAGRQLNRQAGRLYRRTPLLTLHVQQLALKNAQTLRRSSGANNAGSPGCGQTSGLSPASAGLSPRQARATHLTVVPTERGQDGRD